MTALRIWVRFAAAGLAITSACSAALTSDALPEPRPEPAAFEEPQGEIRIEDALAAALMGNHELQGFSWEMRAGEARVLQARKRPNPELDFRLYRLAQPGMSDEGRGRLIISQDFELGKKRKRRVALASSERALAEWDYKTKRVEVAAVVTARVAAVLGAQRRAESETRFVEFIEATGAKVGELVHAGRLGNLETHRVARRAGLARVDLERAKSLLSAARFALAATWGSRRPLFVTVVGDLERMKPVPDIETVLAFAENSPTLARWDTEIARSEAAVKLARSGRVPDLQYGIGVRREQGMSDDDYLIDLEIDLPIFDRKQGEIREAQYGLARTRSAREAARALAAERIAEAYYALSASEVRSRTLRNEVLPAARAIFSAFDMVFEENATNVDDLLDARRDVARAERDHTEALVDYQQSLATLESLVGRDFSLAP